MGDDKPRLGGSDHACMEVPVRGTSPLAPRRSGSGLHEDCSLKSLPVVYIPAFKAYGLKWRKWSIKILFTSQSWSVPEKHRDPGLIKFQFDGSYTINQHIYRILLNLNNLQFTDAPRRREGSIGFRNCLSGWKEIIKEFADSMCPWEKIEIN